MPIEQMGDRTEGAMTDPRLREEIRSSSRQGDPAGLRAEQTRRSSELEGAEGVTSTVYGEAGLWIGE